MYPRKASVISREGRHSVTGRNSFAGSERQSVLGMTYGYEPKNPYIQEILSHPSRRSIKPSSRLMSTINVNLEPTVVSEFSTKNFQKSQRFVPRKTFAAESFRKNKENNFPSKIQNDGFTDKAGRVGRADEESDVQEDSVITAYDVEVQVRPRMREKGTQSVEIQQPSYLPETRVENEEVMEENFRMRRLVEDLRFRLAETANEAESLHNELTLLRKTPRKKSKEIREVDDKQIQTEKTDLIRRNSSVNEAFLSDEDEVSDLPSMQPVKEMDRVSRTVSCLNLRELLDTDEQESLSSKSETRNKRQNNDTESRRENSDTEAPDYLREIMHGYVTRTQFLEEIEEEKIKRSQTLVQSTFRGHLERLKFLKQNKKL